MRTVTIIGAGVAGLAAAVAASAAGWAVRLHEASPEAGGRCRTVTAPDGTRHDNGTHVLLGANRAALAFLRRIGAYDRWVEPEPDGLPLVDLADGRTARVGLTPGSWLRPDRRPPGLGLADLWPLAALAMPGRDRPLGVRVKPGPLRRSLIEPLTVAALNTPVAEASSARLGAVLRGLMRPGAGRLLVARDGLTDGLVAPALAHLARAGVSVALGDRLRAVEHDGRTATALVFADRTVPVDPGARVVLALPPRALARLLPDLPVPIEHEPIVNLHYGWGAPGPRFIGLLGARAQWALVRPEGTSVTISAGTEALADDPGDLSAMVWDELCRALPAAGVATPPAAVPAVRRVVERFATVRQAAGPSPRPPHRPLDNLCLAGDWLDASLPATIEAAVRSGVAAAA
jgi:hydroxysqualene dehydroxylase